MPDSVAEQARQVNQNLQAVLMEASMDVSDIVKMTIYLTDLRTSARSCRGFLADPRNDHVIVNQRPIRDFS